MIVMRISAPQDIPRLWQLWGPSMGGQRELSNYFDCLYSPERAFVLEENGKILSALATFPLSLVLPDGARQEAIYLYVMGTDPAGRGNGYGRNLLYYVEDFGRKHCVDCVLTAPFNVSLFRYFEAMGYCSAFSHRKLEVPKGLLAPLPEAGGIRTANAEEYQLLRERLLLGRLHVAYTPELIAKQRELSRRRGGDIFLLENGGTADGVLTAQRLGDSMVIQELLCPEGQIPLAVALLAAEYPAERYYVRYPTYQSGVQGSYIQPFGLVKWLSPAPDPALLRETHGYMGLAFD